MQTAATAQAEDTLIQVRATGRTAAEESATMVHANGQSTITIPGEIRRGQIIRIQLRQDLIRHSRIPETTEGLHGKVSRDQITARQAHHLTAHRSPEVLAAVGATGVAVRLVVLGHAPHEAGVTKHQFLNIKHLKR